MTWQTQSILGVCDSCHEPIVPGEPVRLVRGGRDRWCWMCARRRLMETVPRERPDQPTPKVFVGEGDRARWVERVEARFDRNELGATLRTNILTRRELERANANDPKLKQLGGDR